MLNIVKIIYNTIYANKKIPVGEKTWKELNDIKSAGQTYDMLLQELIEKEKKSRLERDIEKWEADESVDFEFKCIELK